MNAHTTPRRPAFDRARNFSRLLLIVSIAAAAFAHVQLGNGCTLGIGSFQLSCPLGWIQTSLATRTLMPELWLSAGIMALLAILFGRTFCGWPCPAGWVGRALDKRENKSAVPRETKVNSEPRWGRYAALAGVIGASYLFRFPVFCLVCPVGLSFGFIFALTRLVETHQIGWDLLIYPAAITLEFLLLRRWCQTLCPVGGLAGLLGSKSKFLIPRIDRDNCLSGSRNCHACQTTCPEGIDLVSDPPAQIQEDCTRCMVCTEKCPTHTISIGKKV